MNRSYRDGFAITAQMLNAARSGINKTGIMQRAALNFEQLQRYIGKLHNCGLLGYNENTIIYQTTPKGFDYLSLYTKTQGIEEEVKTIKAELQKLLSPDENKPKDEAKELPMVTEE